MSRGVNRFDIVKILAIEWITRRLILIETNKESLNKKSKFRPQGGQKQFFGLIISIKRHLGDLQPFWCYQRPKWQIISRRPVKLFFQHKNKQNKSVRLTLSAYWNYHWSKLEPIGMNHSVRNRSMILIGLNFNQSEFSF